MRSAILPFLMVVVGAGCAPQSLNALPAVPEPPAPEPEQVVVTNITVGGDDVEQADSRQDAQRAPERGGVGLRATGVGPSRDPVFFHIGAGYGALGRVDLDPCRDRGLVPGFLHMHVTFRSNGRVARAIVESLTPPPSEALACISEHLATATVPEFEGDDVTLSKSFYVVPDGRGPSVLVENDVVFVGPER
jgi:hypothetical protein